MYSDRIILAIIILLFCSSQHSCDNNNKEAYDEGRSLAHDVKAQIYELFDTCFRTTMPNQKFVSSNLHSFINFPSKTTVGFSPKFTTNRKFFANMIGTAAFKNMLEIDVQELKSDLIRKMKYCDEAIMDQNILYQYYDREVDLTKL